MVKWKSLLSAAAAILVSVAIEPESCALNITIELDTVNTVYPSFDPDASKLLAVMNYAATTYEEIFLDSHDLLIKVSYDNSNTASQYSGGTSPPAQQNHQGKWYRRPGIGAITLSQHGTGPSHPGFYFPDSLQDYSDFVMQRISYQDLPAYNQGSYTGSVPSFIEIGYGGLPLSYPQLTDARIVALHELGHILGIAGTGGGTLSSSANLEREGDDGDYDLNPLHVGGNAMSVSLTQIGGGHLAANYTVMNSSAGGSWTYGLGGTALPSTIDILAMAASMGWDEIDLPRKDFWGGADWHASLNWAGNRVPDSDDDAYVQSGSQVQLTAAAAARRLIVRGDSAVATNGNSLAATGVYIGNHGQLIATSTSGSTIATDLVMSYYGTLKYSVSSMSPQIVISGSATLDGTLCLEFGSGISAAPGDTFQLISTTSTSGQFARVDWIGIENGLGISVDYATDGVLATVETLSGDANNDGVVNGSDSLEIDINFGQSGSANGLLLGDANDDGYVNSDDYDAVNAAWGSSWGPPAAIDSLLLGDANNDGVVNGSDILEVEANLGAYDLFLRDGRLLGDANDDHIVNEEDLDAVYNNFGAVASASVPEPGHLGLFSLCMIFLTTSRTMGRVALGDCSPRAPTDPDVRDYRIRFLKQPLCLAG